MNDEKQKTFSPLAGYRILDLSQGVAGPYCAQILGQQGASVIKIEPPEGDWGRHIGFTRQGQSTISYLYNCGKRSLALNAKDPKGQEILLALAQRSDIIVENFRPSVIARMGLDYPTLRARGLDPVYVSISGYGPDGPYADHPATDSIIQADSAVMFINRQSQGVPQRVGFLVADVNTGVYAAQQCTAALLQKALTGQGTHVQINLFAVCCAMQAVAINEETHDEPRQSPSAPNGVFQAQDGLIMILALNDDQFARIIAALGLTHWRGDRRFATNALRLANKEALHADLTQAVKSKTLATLEALLGKHHVLHARVRSAREVLTHPQAQHLGVFTQVDASALGTIYQAALPGMLGLPGQPAPLPAPGLGEHSSQILGELGLSASEIDALMGQVVLGA